MRSTPPSPLSDDEGTLIVRRGPVREAPPARDREAAPARDAVSERRSGGVLFPAPPPIALPRADGSQVQIRVRVVRVRGGLVVSLSPFVKTSPTDYWHRRGGTVFPLGQLGAVLNQLRDIQEWGAGKSLRDIQELSAETASEPKDGAP